MLATKFVCAPPYRNHFGQLPSILQTVNSTHQWMTSNLTEHFVLQEVDFPMFRARSMLLEPLPSTIQVLLRVDSLFIRRPRSQTPEFPTITGAFPTIPRSMPPSHIQYINSCTSSAPFGAEPALSPPFSHCPHFSVADGRSCWKIN